MRLKLFYIILCSFFTTFALSNVYDKKYNSYLLPKILSEKDIAIYESVLTHYEKYEWEEAERILSKVENKILLGHLQYEKLMHPNKYKATYQELSEWFITYDDYPPVLRNRIYKLLIKRLPDKKNSQYYEKPLFNNYLRGYGEDFDRRYKVKPSKNINKKEVKRIISSFMQNEEHYQLIDFIKRNHSKEKYVFYLINNEIKKVFFSGNIVKSKKLYDLYISSLEVIDPDIFFRAGINSYRLENFETAKTYFTKCNKLVNKTNSWLSSGCLYWSAMLEESEKNQYKNLKKAALFPRTIYGQLAIEKLKISEPFIWQDKKVENKIDFNDLSRNKLFKRAIALTELQLYNYADIEIRNLYSIINKKEIENLFYASEKLELPAVLMRLGSKFYSKNPTLYMRGLYPTPDWRMDEGYQLDKALLFALIRRESAFNFKAKSSKGARGLMQIMPRTASKLNNDYRLRYNKAYKLYSLHLNMEIGQKFLKRLIKSPNTNNSILDTLIAYNAGIKRLKIWKKNIVNVEPIVFIESIPIKETRWFVKYILTDLWIYRDRLQQKKPSRTLLAKGKAPIYKKLDFRIIQDAQYKR